MSETVNRKLMSFKAGCAKAGYGRSKMYDLIAEGRITAYKDGHQTKIDEDSLDAHMAALPRLVLKPSKRRAAPAVEPV
jgi:excisionase family DNA binding protein